MSQRYARLLNDQDQVEHFLDRVLDFDFSEFKNITYEIIQGEQGIVNLDLQAQTLNNTRYRDRNYKSDKLRWELRAVIISELLSLKRPENDDDITLGYGGALPNTELKRDRKAYILIGLPASGKSGIANSISEQFNSDTRYI